MSSVCCVALTKARLAANSSANGSTTRIAEPEGMAAAAMGAYAPIMHLAVAGVHAEHDVRPVSYVVWPAAHSEQFAAPGVVPKKPRGHGMHADEPGGAK